MAIDPRNSLSLAFQHLDLFSVPEIGTFRKVRQSAVVDHQSGKILPPCEKFVWEKGFDHSSALREFLSRHHQVPGGEVGHLPFRISDHLLSEIKSSGQASLSIAGVLKPSPAELGAFEIAPSTLNLHPGDFFGLPTLSFNLSPKSESPTQTEREAAAKRYAALKDAPVEPAPKPVRRRGKRNTGRNIVVVLLLAVMAASMGGIIWQDKVQTWMKSVGLVTTVSEGQKPEVQTEKPVTVLQPTRQQPVVKLDENNTAVVKADDQPVKHSESVVPPVTEVENLISDLSDWNGMGQHAQSGTYYLVVGATSDAVKAKEMATSMSKDGIKASVLVPRAEGPMFKIVAFQSKDKSSVIQKMVEWKDRFPEKSWIFWMGM
jgi:hypothetical protein